MNNRNLIDSVQMARFVSDGYLRLDGVVPEDLCQATLKEMASGELDHSEYRMRPFEQLWQGKAIGEVFRLPQVEGMIESLVGPSPAYDHHAVHRVKERTKIGPNLHQDAEYDRRFEAFDIQVSYFAQQVTPEMGGTLFVPGTHFRQVHEAQIIRYQSIAGQQQMVCPAGTLVFWHHNIWHSARSNSTDAVRYMFKVRLNPQVKQERLWDTRDLDDPQIEKILTTHYPWMGQAHRIEVMNRIRMWRALTGNPAFDIANWWGRVENLPGRRVAV